MKSSNLIIRSFKNIDDIYFAYALTKSEKWYSETDIELLVYFERDPKGCFIAEINNEKVGICFATAYTHNGFIGELIVSPKHRNKGIGTALMSEAIHYLENQKIKNIFLDGVIKAIPLYKKLGFSEICRSLRLFGEIEPISSPFVKPIRKMDLEKIFLMDLEYFGEDRSYFLTKRFQNYPILSLKLVLNNEIQSYIFGREGIGGWITAGPLVSLTNADETMILLRSFQERIGFQPFSIGILETQKEIIPHLIHHGLKPNPDPPIRMVHGNGQNLGGDFRCISIGSPAKG